MQTQFSRTLCAVIFVLGIFIGLALAAVAIWGEFEAVSYFFTGTTFSPFNGLKCPILMTRAEVGNIRAAFRNPTNEEYDPYYQVEIGGILPRNFEDQLAIPAHQSKSVQWTVDAKDIDLGYFIFVKLDVLPNAVFPTREATCGIMVLNLAGLTGGQVFGAAFIISLLGMLLGLSLFENAHKPVTDSLLNLLRAMRALAIVVLLAMFAGFIGWWLVGTILCAIAILLLVINLGLAIS